MVTTSRLVLLDAVRREGEELIHLTGPLQVVARAAMDEVAGSACQVDLRFDAARVRGVGLKTGTRYWAEGLHQCRHQPEGLSAPLEVVGFFRLLCATPDAPQPTRLTLIVRFRVTVPADGRVTVAAEEVQLLPHPGAAA
jgi:hypothetical protein